MGGYLWEGMCNGTGHCVPSGVPLNCKDETKSVAGNALYSMYMLPWSADIKSRLIIFPLIGCYILLTGEYCNDDFPECMRRCAIIEENYWESCEEECCKGGQRTVKEGKNKHNCTQRIIF